MFSLQISQFHLKIGKLYQNINWVIELKNNLNLGLEFFFQKKKKFLKSHLHVCRFDRPVIESWKSQTTTLSQGQRNG